MSCASPSTPENNKELWAFDASKNQPSLDDQLTPLIHDYDAMFKELSINDTAILFSRANALITSCDSISKVLTMNDTALMQVVKMGLLNMQDELQGLIAEQYPDEIHQSMNMLSIHLLHLLGNIGYQKQSIYIFNTQEYSKDQEEDGWVWASLNKKSINPYNNSNNKLFTAIMMLQEAN